MHHLTYFRELWETSSTDFPRLNKEYSFHQKILHEKKFDSFFHSLRESLNESKTDNNQSSENPVFSQIRNFLKEGLDYSDDQLDIILSNDMIANTLHFINEARSFDKELGLEEIFQACRNVWIMNGLQYLFGQQIRLTPSIFAYSMLYPYTDNFIDDVSVSAEEKQAFAERFYKRLDNQVVEAANATETKIFQLVAKIEEEWPRDLYPDVYTSLLAIHEAQTKSSALLTESHSLPKEEVFDICVNKGGCSVMADGYLILGNLNEEQEKFLYGYGAYLQILDDLQDVYTDSRQGLMTCFSEAARRDVIDEYASRTFWLGEMILKSVEQLSYANKSVFFSLMEKSIELFILESVISAGSLFSNKYVKAFKRFSPVRISYLTKRRDLLGSYPKNIIEKIAEIAIHQFDPIVNELVD
ncbi:hypothetical protein [Carboxylicivirga caseinilyticus]|uniref:hypothetical protein n=1 Tax=Carboxylicivirga caseinilyticus TaxID=3417572 RepID=UPI003D342D4D|nr:hypothetical protein [Marinilabiliaceae bacterium A049]